MGDTSTANVPEGGYGSAAPVARGELPCNQANPRDEGPPLKLLPKPARIIGRDADIRAAAEHLSTRRFVTVSGPAGIGKTTLGVALAHELGRQFRDGVAFLDLAKLQDPHQVAGAVAPVLGLVDPVEDLLFRLLELLRARQLLLVLDNCEHVVEAVAWLAGQIHHCTRHVSILATSRKPLHAAGEFVFELASLEMPPEGLGGETRVMSYPRANSWRAR